MSKLLLKANKYEKEMIGKIDQEQRPVFHFSAPVGWINDPNGFSMFKDEYHLFYQYYPYDTFWGSMHWGHGKSKDLIHWEYLPAALAPDQKYDHLGVFSGGAIGVKEKHYLMYTGVEEKRLPDGSTQIRQNQCLAVGDGVHYEKFQSNPVITADMLPEGSSMADFRDPKLWQEDGVYYVVAGSRHQDGSGQIALFSSLNLYDWSFCTILAHSANQLGKMWECPDFFPLGNQRILLISPQEVQAEGLELHNGNGIVFMLGTYDKDRMKFEPAGIQSCDYGLDFYAAQTMETADGRRVMIGWMQSWDNHMCPAGFLWSGMYSIPRELFMKAGRVCQVPVREIERYRKNQVFYESVTLEKEISLNGVCGRSIDLLVDLQGGDYELFEIRLAANETYYSSIQYNRTENTVTFDRTYSGYSRDVISSRKMPVRDRGGKLTLRILLDRYSCEIFANNGEQAMTSLVLTPQDGTGIKFLVRGRVLASICKYDIVND